MLINTGRGRLADTDAALVALRADTLGSLGLDVYEKGRFFENHSDNPTAAPLINEPNVYHYQPPGIPNPQSTTIASLDAWAQARSMNDLVTVP